jgi:hypothetical protein
VPPNCRFTISNAYIATAKWPLISRQMARVLPLDVPADGEDMINIYAGLFASCLCDVLAFAAAEFHSMFANADFAT